MLIYYYTAVIRTGSFQLTSDSGSSQRNQRTARDILHVNNKTYTCGINNQECDPCPCKNFNLKEKRSKEF